MMTTKELSQAIEAVLQHHLPAQVEEGHITIIRVNPHNLSISWTPESGPPRPIHFLVKVGKLFQ